MKTLYFFKPTKHWNVTTEAAYNYLMKFYDSSYFMTREETEG